MDSELRDPNVGDFLRIYLSVITWQQLTGVSQ